MYTRADARWLSDTVGALYAAQDVRTLSESGIASVYGRFRLVASGFEEISYDHSRYLFHGARCERSPPADHAAYIHDHPAAKLIGQSAGHRVVQIRQLVSFREWKKTDNYNGIARPMGYNDHLSILAYGTTGFLAFGLLRDTMFTAQENSLLTLLHAHIQAAWQRVHAESGPFDPAHPAQLALDSQFRPAEVGPRQRRLLRRYFPHWREPDALPEELRGWVAASLRQLRQAVPLRPLTAYVAHSAHGRLLVRCFPNPENGAILLHLVESPHLPSFLDLRQRGLTPRECEVLHWIAQGKRDGEIAAILACSPATVGKHVENLLRKLHAENRGSAVGVAQGWLGALP